MIRDTFLWACDVDIKALKPGNVGWHGDGHRMQVVDFQKAAHAAAAAMGSPLLTVGQRIRQAVEASVAATGCNVNLGIVLLCAPLVQAAWSGARDLRALHEQLRTTLAGLTLADSRDVAVAISLANPGGLGTRTDHDVRDVRNAPTLPLRAWMAEAQQQDTIAAQYANDYQDIFDHGVPCWQRAQERGWSAQWCATVVFVNFLAQRPDSHLQRRHPDQSQAVSARARHFRDQLDQLHKSGDNPALATADLLDWDRQLKAHGLNPGTSADMTVATALAVRLATMNFPHHAPSAEGKMTRDGIIPAILV